MNWSRKSNRGSPQCGAFAVGPLVGAPGVGGMTPGLYRRASAAEAPLPRASLCLRTVFRGSAEVFVRLYSGRRGRSLRAAVCEAVHGSDVSPPAREACHACFALRATVRRGKRGTVWAAKCKRRFCGGGQSVLPACTLVCPCCYLRQRGSFRTSAYRQRWRVCVVPHTRRWAESARAETSSPFCLTPRWHMVSA